MKAVKTSERGSLALPSLPRPIVGVLSRATGEEISALRSKVEAVKASGSTGSQEELWDCFWALVRVCADREASLLAAAAAEVSEHHTNIGAAEILLGMVTGAHRATRLVDFSQWTRLNIPGSQLLPSLRDVGVLVQPAFGGRALAGGEPTLCSRKCEAAAQETRAALEELMGVDLVGVLRKQAGGTHG